MSDLGSLGIRGLFIPRRENGATEWVLRQHALTRILAFRRRSIDDVVNHPWVKNEILGYYKLQMHIDRVSQTRELERQWNSLG